MDKYTLNSLIANSGIHFKTSTIEFNPEEPLLIDGGKTLKYTFLETIDFLNDQRVRLDLCSSKDSLYVPINSQQDKDAIIEKSPNGTVVLDAAGVPKIKKDTIMALTENYPAGSPQLMSVNSLSSLRIKDGTKINTGFELLLEKWLPMPMYEEELNGMSTGFPNGWCRVKIIPMDSTGKNGMKKYRLVWAFDTKLAEDASEGLLRPAFLQGSGEKKTYSLCNRADLLLGTFLNIPDGHNDAPIADYIASLLGIDLQSDAPQKYKFIAYYVYLVNFLRLSGASPKITLFNKTDGKIPVDMSIDIGNSRTCAVLFEQGNFKKAKMLRIQDFSEPWHSYEDAFDMRIVFRKADIGGDITQGKNLFQWNSLVRIGEEARHLIYRSQQGHGESERTTNYSSPKRYLWDDEKYEKRWELMVINGDPTNITVSPQIYLEGFTDHFDDDGTYLEEVKEIDLFNLGQNDDTCHYSRKSLMTFVMIEILQQAMVYINSSKFRFMHANIDCQRYLRNIIVTCPTAMPLKEQRVLRQAAKDATKLLRSIDPSLPEVTITPDPDKIQAFEDMEDLEKRGWLYDEALASQLVYLYAELAERYGGRVEHFLDVKGHVRPELEEYGFEGKSLTIGTIDIGAGTTDIMITAYGHKGAGSLTPIPIYYDSFYTAGDDIIHNIIRDIILEGIDGESPIMGSISSALSARIQKMTADELLTIPRVRERAEYRSTIDAIRNAYDEEEEEELKRHLTHELMHHFFAEDSANMSERDRQCRIDFCTQVSVPMAQFFLELLKQNRPSKLYSFDELFPNEKPADYLLEHFAYHFGFRFEELSWRYVPTIVGNIVRDTMEPLMKVLSVVMFAHNCDVLVLSGRPTNLEPLTELFLKYLPIAPNRLVLLNEYRVGRWFPLATEEGYFQEKQKAVVAVGAEVGYIASTTGYNGLVLDFSKLSKIMKSTACYMGKFDEDLEEVHSPYLTPNNSTANLRRISVFPYYIGCKQYDSRKYPGRPIYAIYNESGVPQLNIMLQRNYHDDRETLIIEEVTDMEGEPISDPSKVKLRLQTIAHDGEFWMDKGAFILKIQEN